MNWVCFKNSGGPVCFLLEIRCHSDFEIWCHSDFGTPPAKNHSTSHYIFLPNSCVLFKIINLFN